MVIIQGETMRPLSDLLEDLTLEYIYSNFQPELIATLHDSFNILVRFDLPEYEYPYTDLIYSSEDNDSDVTRDKFIATLKSQLTRVINDHSVTLDSDSEIQMSELNDILYFLLLVQDLEDTAQLSYRLNGAGTGKSKFVDLLSYYTTIPLYRGMELLETVGSNLIAAMIALVRDKSEDSPVDATHLKVWNDFVLFLHEAESGDKISPLGYEMRCTGYFNLTVAQTLALSGLDLRKRIDDEASSSIPTAALDLLSLLLICKDSYADPLQYLEDNAATLVNGVELLSRLRVAMSSMLTDLNNYLTATKQRV